MSRNKVNLRREARDAWALRYEITSIRGTLYTRAMLRARARRILVTVVPRMPASWVDGVLDDDSWMRGHRGAIPHFTALEIALETLRRWVIAGSPKCGAPDTPGV